LIGHLTDEGQGIFEGFVGGRHAGDLFWFLSGFIKN
jgi:hypothetical protein